MPLTRPTTTPMPDEIYDEWAPRLTEAELKALLYIVRRTLGFHKRADAISLTQFATGIVTRDGRVLDHGCGITSRPTLVRALRGLEAKGLIQATKARTGAGDRAVTVYALRWEEGESDGLDGEARVSPDGGGARREPPGARVEPRWFPLKTSVVSSENYGGARMTPTTHSLSRDSQQNRTTPRAHAPTLCADGGCGSRAGEADEVWQVVIADLSEVMTAENVAQWLMTAQALACDAHDLRVGVPTALHQHWLDQRLRRTVEAALQRGGYGALSVTFEVIP